MTDTTTAAIEEQHSAIVGWLRNPWSNCDNQPRGPIPEWCGALMFEAANIIDALAAELATARAERDEWKRRHDHMADGWKSSDEEYETELAALRGEVARLRAGIAVLAAHPEDEGAHMCGDFRDFYRDQCNYAARLLTALTSKGGEG